MISSEAPGVTPSVIFRLGLATAGGLFIYAATVLASSVTPATATLNVPILVVLGGLGLFALASAGVLRPPPHLRWLILGAYVMQVIIQAQFWVQFSRVPGLIPTDVGLNTDLAGILIRHGENPYTWDFSGVFDLYRTQQGSSTPLLNSASVSRYSYPVLLFLLVVPFQALGLPGVFTLSIVAHLGVLVLTFLATPRRWQPVILLPAVAGFDFVNLTLIGTLDIVWILGLVAMVAAWRRPTLRAILYGLAVSLKQSPALLAPFLLIRLWNEDDRGQPPAGLARFLFITGATFLLFNGPFLLWNPVAWFNGYTDPIRNSLVILSQGGLSTITQGGILYLPKLYFLFVTLSAFGLLIFMYWRHYAQLRHALWIFPGIFMWFSYRTLVSYWLFWCFPMLLAVVIAQPSFEPPGRHNSWRSTLAVVFGSLLVLFAAGAVLASPKAPVLIRLQLPMFAGEGARGRLVVDVTNLGAHTLTPRFAIQSRSNSTNPLPWYIEHGPLVLSAGEHATYTIASNRSDRVFHGREPVQLVVTDAGGDYSLRGVLAIESDPGLRWPDMMLNGEFRMWDETRGMPLYWQPSNVDSASLEIQDGRPALVLTAHPASGRPQASYLSTSFLYPGVPFGMWLYPPAGGSKAYGLEILDGRNQLWILFGPDSYRGPLDEGAHVIQRTVPAQAWTYQEIDLQAAYGEAGLSLPALSRTYYRGLDIDAQLFRLRLFFTNDQATTYEAFFGPIIQSSDHLTPRTLMADTLNDPAAYYQRLGRSYEGQRNTARALEAYQRALSFAPEDRGILASIEGLKQELAGEMR
ncbi:MAG: glycosyltransferase 87 family protein [Chloroflexota bacterium]